MLSIAPFAALCASLLLDAASALRSKATDIELTGIGPSVIGINGHGGKMTTLGDLGVNLSFHINLTVPKGLRAGLPQSSDTFLQVDTTAALAGMNKTDVTALLDGFRKAAGPEKSPFIWTVTDGGMVDFAQNMLTSLDELSCAYKRLIVAMGKNTCKEFTSFSRTTCVEIFPMSGSEDAASWGTSAYFEVVLRKHAVLAMLATSGLSSVSVFTDPDVVFLQDPVDELSAVAGGSDIVFTPNNYLDKNPQSVVDVAEEYTTRGMESIVVGPKGRRADINTGLLFLRSSPVVSDLMLRTMLIFKSEGGTHGHYQQYSLVAALKYVPEVKISVSPGDVFVNGNVFWGHRRLLDPSRVVSIHANWMASAMKRNCFKTAGLWKLGGKTGKDAKWLNDLAVLDNTGKTVQSCAAGDGTAAVTKPEKRARLDGAQTDERLPRESATARSFAGIPMDVAVSPGAAEAAQLGSMLQEDVAALVGSIKKTAGDDKKPFVVTVTDAGMVDMAQNMLRSLDAVPSRAARLVVCMGANLCSNFDSFNFLTCVEVYKDSKPEDEVSWGSQEYFRVVLRKHVILTIIANSKLTSASIYTDPDIAFLDSPVGQFRKYSKHFDLVFSPNNYLAKDAQSCEDVAAIYAKQGIDNVRIGEQHRRVDINTGLFVMRGNQRVADMMMDTLKIFKAEEGHHGHFQQYSLAKALQARPDVKITVAPGEFFVNGNVFWGHRSLLVTDKVVSIHANWMESGMKRKCLQAAGLWFNTMGARRLANFSWVDPGDKVVMDDKGKTVKDCIAPPGALKSAAVDARVERIGAAAELGGMSGADVSALLTGVGKAVGGTHSPTILTVTDAAMVELLQNMLRSLDAIPSTLPRVVVAIGQQVCPSLAHFSHTACVEIFADSSPGGGAVRGSSEFQRTALRKQAVLAMVAVSGLVSGPLIYSDPDVVFLEQPEKRLSSLAAGYDILFTPDQFLQKDAKGCEDVSDYYSNRGLGSLKVGKSGYHPDINTGLFYVEKLAAVADLMLIALATLKEQEKDPHHTQHFALLSAIQGTGSLRIGVAPGDVFVNGNVFWGHRAVIDTAKVASVHANWMSLATKKSCLEAAGLWIDESTVASFSWADKGDKGALDDRGAMVIGCSAR